MIAKKLAGEKATEYIQPNMIIGLGTGSTVYWTVLKIAHMVKRGLLVTCVSSSEQTTQLAKENGLEIADINDIRTIYLTIDGADEIDPNGNLIKGGGGALLREKIIASMSERFIVVADESKEVKCLGAFPLPVEIVQYGYENTRRELEKLGCESTLRMDEDSLFKTDNQNYIVDCSFQNGIEYPEELAERINQIPGVVDNGLFVNMADVIIVANKNGEVREKSME